jgi:hypothetical protein
VPLAALTQSARFLSHKCLHCCSTSHILVSHVKVLVLTGLAVSVLFLRGDNSGAGFTTQDHEARIRAAFDSAVPIDSIDPYHLPHNAPQSLAPGDLPNDVAAVHTRLAALEQGQRQLLGALAASPRPVHASARGVDIQTPTVAALPGSAACPQGTYLLIGVLASAHPHSKARRDGIRKGWGTLVPVDLDKRRRVATIFLLAKSREAEMATLRKEAAEHQDIIFLDTVEEYKNLAEKVRLFFKWSVDACDENLT